MDVCLCVCVCTGMFPVVILNLFFFFLSRCLSPPVLFEVRLPFDFQISDHLVVLKLNGQQQHRFVR